MVKAKKNTDVAGAERPAVIKPAAGAPQESRRQPVRSFRIEDVSAAVWERKLLVRGEERTFYSVSFERSYKDANGQYRYSRSFDLDSLGKVVTVAQQAAEFIHGLEYSEPEGAPGTK